MESLKQRKNGNPVFIPLQPWKFTRCLWANRTHILFPGFVWKCWRKCTVCCLELLNEMWDANQIYRQINKWQGRQLLNSPLQQLSVEEKLLQPMPICIPGVHWFLYKAYIMLQRFPIFNATFVLPENCLTSAFQISLLACYNFSLCVPTPIHIDKMGIIWIVGSHSSLHA